MFRLTLLDLGPVLKRQKTDDFGTPKPVSQKSLLLVGAVGWALIFGVVYYGFGRYLRGALVLTVGVLSHWLLDAVVHRPDLPILPTVGPYVGLGLWNSVIGTVTLELGLFVLGVALYLHMTRAKDRIGWYALWSLFAFLLIVWIANLMGPPPPN